MPNAQLPSCLRPVPDSAAAEPSLTGNAELLEVSRTPWLLRSADAALIVRPSTTRDLPGVARMHGRCAPRTLLDRYRCGGRAPGIAAVDSLLRHPLSVVAATSDGQIVAMGTLRRDPSHSHYCAEMGLLVEDRWQRRGVGAELAAHLAGVAQVAGFHEVVAYPGTAVPAAQRLMIEIGRSRMVPGADAHLHTYLPESAPLGLGSVRQRLAG